MSDRLLRVALVSQEYPPETASGGIGSQTYLKAHGLAARGHSVHVISLAPDDERQEYTDGHVQVQRIPASDGRLSIESEVLEWLTYSAEVAIALSDLHTRMPFDLVDFPEWGCEGYVHLLNQTEWNRIPTVVQLHGPVVMFAHTLGWPELDSEFYRVATAMEGTCLRLADAVFSSSACSADWCARHYGLERDRIPRLHTGVDTRLFYPRAIPKEERPTIVFAGNLVESKGVKILLEAACQLTTEYPELRLLLLGNGDEEIVDELQTAAASTGFADLLEMPGYVDRRELPVHFSRAHVFAAPSRYEGGPGFVYLEAMACGLPVIACDGSGASEVVTHGKNGLLVPPDDVTALTEALHRLLADRELRETMSAQGLRYVREQADSEVCLKELEMFYRDVVERCKETS